MSAFLPWLAALGMLAPPPGNRLWLIQVELSGPFEEVLLDCGADGWTRVLGPALEGEEWKLAVPVPVRCPLGKEGLASLPMPRVELLPAGSQGACRILGWSEEQPDERVGGLALARPRPLPSEERPRAGLSELLVVLLAFLLLLRSRGSALAMAAIALAGGALAFGLARSRGPASGALVLFELDPGARSSLQVRAAQDEIALGPGRLEVVPEASRVELEVRAGRSLEGVARAQGATLYALERGEPLALDARENGWRGLEAAWTRGRDGTWREHGTWPRGEPLPAAKGRGAPPGWLASGLVPGPSVLLARVEGNTWVRFVGFETPGAGD